MSTKGMAVFCVAALAAATASGAQWFYTDRGFFFDGVAMPASAAERPTAQPSLQDSPDYVAAEAKYIVAEPLDGWKLGDGEDEWAVVDSSQFFKAANGYLGGKPVLKSKLTRWEAPGARLSGQVLELSTQNAIFKSNAPKFVDIVPCFSWMEYDLEFYPCKPGMSGKDGFITQKRICYTNDVYLAESSTPSFWTREHHKFIGLSTLPGAEKPKFRFGDSFSYAEDGVYPGKLFGASVHNPVVRLYGVWEPIRRRIWLDTGSPDAEIVTKSVIVSGDEKCPALPSPSLTNNTFKGWFYDNGKAVMEGDGIEESLIVRASWLPWFNAVFRYHDGTDFTEETVKVDKGDYAEPPESLDYDNWIGHKFIEWNPNPSDCVIESAVEFNAVYKTNVYTVTFNSNDENAARMNQLFTWGVTNALQECTFARGGCEFMGWSFSEDGEIDFTDGAEVANLTSDDSGDVYLYAVWGCKAVFRNLYNSESRETLVRLGSYAESPDDLDYLGNTGYHFTGWLPDVAETPMTNETEFIAQYEINTYKVVFDPNGGDGNAKEQDFVWDKSGNLNACTFSRDGYAFIGWAESADGEVKYVDCQEVLKLTDENGGIVRLYAVWKDFESGFAGATGAKFYLSLDPVDAENWSVDTNEYVSGESSVKFFREYQSGAFPSCLAGSVSTAGTLSFKWKCNRSIVHANNNWRGPWFGFTPADSSDETYFAAAPGKDVWTDVSVEVDCPEGAVFQWHADKYTVYNDDAATDWDDENVNVDYILWIDDIKFTPTGE